MLTRAFFGVIGAYVSLMASGALTQSLRGAPVPPEIGSRLFDGALLLTTLAAGLLILLTAIVARRSPAFARRAGLGGGVLLVAQAIVNAGFVLAWEPPPQPALEGMRVGELVGYGLWIGVGAAVLKLSTRLRSRPSDGSAAAASRGGQST